MSHQTEALRRRTLRPPGFDDAFADIMETGAGKSFVLLAEFQEMLSAGYVSDLLLVAPAGSYRNWYADKTEDERSEIAKHLDPILLATLRVAGWSARRADRDAVRRLATVVDKRPRALFVNVEAISTSQECTDLCAQFLRERGALMAVDESTVIRGAPRFRNKGSIRTRRVLDLGRLAKARRLLSGLITPKSPMDLYWQMHFLDPRILGHDTFVNFRARYAKVRRTCFEPNQIIRDVLRRAMGLKTPGIADGVLREKLRLVYDGRRKVPPTMPRRDVLTELEVAAEGMSREDAVECVLRLGAWIRSTVQIAKNSKGESEFRNLEELQAKIAPFSYRALKEDCMDLPPKVYEIREVELTPEQRRMYDELVAKAVTELEGQHVVTKNVVSRMLRLHQVVLGHCADETGVVFDVPSRRVDSLVELLEDHSGAAIIWSSYRREIDKIVARLRGAFGPRSVAEFHGGNRGTRPEEERRFLGDDSECRFMVSTPAAGGRGNTWVRPSLAVYCSNSFDLEHRLQSEDRNHRWGQTADRVTYVDLMARGTVEEKIVRALRRKIDLATAITGENYREWLV